jgi:general secretion pathway protein C
MAAQFFNTFQSVDFSGMTRRLPAITVVALLLLLALTTARLIWAFLTPPANTSLVLTTSSATAHQSPGLAKERRDPAAEIVNTHLFGIAEDTATEVKAVEAPETRLNLKLRGVYATSDENTGYALIASGSGDEKLYTTGESLPGNTRLKAVFPDRVILDRKGRYETLRMVDTQATGGSTYIPRRRGAAQTRQLGADSRVLKMRAEILKNPRKLAELVSAQPAYENGVFAGYRIITRRPDPVFDELNLKSGDVITQVNGIAIDSPQKGLQALQQLSRASQASITIKRNGQFMELNLSL